MAKAAPAKKAGKKEGAAGAEEDFMPPELAGTGAGLDKSKAEEAPPAEAAEIQLAEKKRLHDQHRIHELYQIEHSSLD